jgi:hypothetical protein
VTNLLASPLAKKRMQKEQFKSTDLRFDRAQHSGIMIH